MMSMEIPESFALSPTLKGSQLSKANGCALCTLHCTRSDVEGMALSYALEDSMQGGERMLPTVVERARKRSLEEVDKRVIKRKNSEKNNKAIPGNDISPLSKVRWDHSLTLEEGSHEVDKEDEMEYGDEAMNSEVYQELLEEKQFCSDMLPTPTVIERAKKAQLEEKNMMAQNSQRGKEQVESDSGGVMGHIVKVHLNDFMVHRDFEWRPGHCINFITGKNGSGKSSLLQAIVLGLMSGTKHVGRYSRLGDFVRKGSQKATIAVTLHNTGEEAYRKDRYGTTLTFRRTICLRGLSTLELCDWKGSVTVSGRAALQEAANILRALNIQLENPLTILQQDHAKEMLQVEKPERLYSFFESATMISQCRAEYKRSATELALVTRNIEGMKKEMVELKTEANFKREMVKEGIRMRKRDEYCADLEKQHAWAKVVRSRNEVKLKEKSLENLNFKKQELLQCKVKTEAKFPEVDQKRFELAKESEEEIASEKQFREKEADWQREEKELKAKRKLLVGQAKNLVHHQKSLGGELEVLEEMKKRLSHSLSQDVLEDIALLEGEVGNLEEQRDMLETTYEHQHLDVTALTQDLKAKVAVLSRQEGEVARLQRELITAGKVNPGQVDNLACYPGARQVENEINRQSSRFEKLPVGPVGRFMR